MVLLVNTGMELECGILAGYARRGKTPDLVLEKEAWEITRLACV